MNYVETRHCRICGNAQLEVVLDLGDQALTGVFPRSVDEPVTRGPLRLVRCAGALPDGSDSCGLLQLQHSFALDEMYGLNYGYRSGLNPKMVEHLHNKVDRILSSIDLADGDLVIDIGSNDATTLRAYPDRGLRLVGIDPTGSKFQQHYPDHVELIADFFSASRLRQRFPAAQAKIVTSFSMFYDLESPLAFMRDVHDILAADGIWVFEQSYMPEMLTQNAYDTVCHEHLEFYALGQIKWMADRVGFVIVDVEFNATNGGSFSVAARKAASGFTQCADVDRILATERAAGLDTAEPYGRFADRVARSRRELVACIRRLQADGAQIHGLGASTKGNVLLQYCGLTRREVASIGEVNGDKVGRLTPGSHIPIVAEDKLLKRQPDYLLVLPWHFRDFFVNAAQFKGQKLIFPLPTLEILEVP